MTVSEMTRALLEISQRALEVAAELQELERSAAEELETRRPDGRRPDCPHPKEARVEANAMGRQRWICRLCGHLEELEEGGDHGPGSSD